MHRPASNPDNRYVPFDERRTRVHTARVILAGDWRRLPIEERERLGHQMTVVHGDLGAYAPDPDADFAAGKAVGFAQGYDAARHAPPIEWGRKPRNTGALLVVRVAFILGALAVALAVILR